MMADSEQQLNRRADAFKAYLLTPSTKTNRNLYDHLTQLLTKVMDERPLDTVDVMEDISLEVKRASLEDIQTTLRDLPQTTTAELLAEQQHLLFSQPEDGEQDDELGESPLPNVSEIGFYLEQAGVSLGREEMHRIFLALQKLVESQALQRCRLWGKILGIESNYIVAEVEHRDGKEEEEQSTDEPAEEEERDAETEENEIDPLPRSTFSPPPVVPMEAPGTGANKFSYYVCKEPGLPWVKLPYVTPAQITTARLIRKFFKGRLDAPLACYPPFPGDEINYLRAQIARISAGTHVSPHGCYHLREEEGDEEEEAPQDSFEINPDFESLPAAEMAESLSNWVHHVPHILQQGRCTWVNLAVKPGDDSNEEGEGDEKEEDPDEPEPETGPPLLTSLSQDVEMFNVPPWSLRLSSTLTPQHAITVLRSNLWPGAFAYTCGKKFENFYVGWGLKHPGEGFNPAVPPPPQTEYPNGPEITETLDPTPEEEQELREALEEQQAAQEELEESDEEDDEDDD